ncbi:MAG: hypothetical protein JW797_14850 [Bradymonadales bacterium]|nr:hypothetical protein [Bradymonadales bacterium]
MHHRLFPVALLVAGSLLLAMLLSVCGIDEQYTGMGQSALPGDPLRPNTPVVIVDCGPCPSCDAGTGDSQQADYGQMTADDLTSMGYRFDSLILTAPLTGFMGDSLNSYFSEQIGDGLLNVLIQVSEDNRTNGELGLVIGSGEASGESYSFSDETSELGCNLSGRYFHTIEPASLVFPNDLLDPPTLPIKFLHLSGWFEADGSAIAEGVLDGALTAEDAAQISIMGSDFVTFFNTMQIPMDLDTDEDGREDAWHFIGTYTATRVTLTSQ